MEIAAPTNRAQKPSIFPIVFAVNGMLLAIYNCIAAATDVVRGYSSGREMVLLRHGTPSQLAAVIGETMIAVSSRGLFAIIPATLLYLALAPFRFRQPWFYTCALICSFYFLVLLPFGTIAGIVLLVALRRRRVDFKRVPEASH